MKDGYIAILDSGIGGLSVLAALIKRLPQERFLYFGDGKNAPYGDKTVSELYLLTRKNLSYILRYRVKAIVFGCNTLSVSVLPLIADKYDAPFFGVYPPLEAAEGKTFLFATPLTCKNVPEKSGVISVPMKDLAADIEKNKNRLSTVDLSRHLENSILKCEEKERVANGSYGHADTVILGCTHYFFIKNQFIDHFCPRKIVSSEDDTARRVKEYLSYNGITANNKVFSVDFIGENAKENNIFYNTVVKDIVNLRKKNKKI